MIWVRLYISHIRTNKGRTGRQLRTTAQPFIATLPRTQHGFILRRHPLIHSLTNRRCRRAGQFTAFLCRAGCVQIWRARSILCGTGISLRTGDSVTLAGSRTAFVVGAEGKPAWCGWGCGEAGTFAADVVITERFATESIIAPCCWAGCVLGILRESLGAGVALARLFAAGLFRTDTPNRCARYFR